MGGNILLAIKDFLKKNRDMLRNKIIVVGAHIAIVVYIGVFLYGSANKMENFAKAMAYIGVLTLTISIVLAVYKKSPHRKQDKGDVILAYFVVVSSTVLFSIIQYYEGLGPAVAITNSTAMGSFILVMTQVVLDELESVREEKGGR